MKNELQSLRFLSPLFPHLYRKNEWGDLDDYREDLSAGEVLEYEDEILAHIQKEKLPDEGERGLAVYLDDDLSQKVYSINPSVEEWNGELWGVTEVQTNDTLSPSELANLIGNLLCERQEPQGQQHLLSGRRQPAGVDTLDNAEYPAAYDHYGFCVWRRQLEQSHNQCQYR